MTTTTCLQQRTPEWFKARRGKLTASTMGSVLGWSPWQKPAQLYDTLKGLRKFEGNVATRYGTDNEVNGVAEYTIMTGRQVDQTGLHLHKVINFIAGSPDGLVGSDGMIEVKCPYNRKLHTQLPLHYYPQINALLEITGRKWCDYVCWTPEGTAITRIQANSEAFAYYLDFYRQFYTCLQTDQRDGVMLSKEQTLQISQQTQAFVESDSVLMPAISEDTVFISKRDVSSDDDADTVRKRAKSSP